MKGETSKLSYVRKGRDSLKTVVPMGIVKQLGLKSGDELNWKIKAEKNDLIVEVRKIKN